MLFFPEACDFICDNKNDMLNYSEPIIGGSIVQKYKELAKKYNVWLSMGGVHEKVIISHLSFTIHLINLN